MKNIQITYLFSVLAAGLFSGISADHTIGHISGRMQKNIALSQGILLDTTGGVANGKRCAVQVTGPHHLIGSGAAGMSYSIECTDGTSFEEIKAIEVSATGTPPYLTYNNYIGSHRKGRGSRMLGQNKRAVYLDKSQSE